MVMKYQAASATEAPTVSSPWFCRMTAFPSVLGDRLERDAEAGEGLAVQGVGVCGRDHVGPGPVHLGVDTECGVVDRALALKEFAVMVDEDQVGDADLAERHPEGVDPEGRGVLRIAGRDVSGHALGEAEAGEQAEGGREFLLADLTLLLDAQFCWGSGRVTPSGMAPTDMCGAAVVVIGIWPWPFVIWWRWRGYLLRRRRRLPYMRSTRRRMYR
jgi:hypothetical protein